MRIRRLGSTFLYTLDAGFRGLLRCAPGVGVFWVVSVLPVNLYFISLYMGGQNACVARQIMSVSRGHCRFPPQARGDPDLLWVALVAGPLNPPSSTAGAATLP